jgi:Aspartate/tyrosine/aromatic aminotransferase
LHAPIHGGRIVATVLNNKELFEEWKVRSGDNIVNFKDRTQGNV